MPIGYSKGTFKKMHNQCIYQKTIFLIIPFILETLFITENNGKNSKGFNIKPQYRWNLVPLVLLGFGGFLFLYLSFTLKVYVLLPIGLIFTGLLAWLLIRLKKSNKKEEFVREQFYRTTNCAIMPEWLLSETFNNFYSSLQEHYKQYFNSSDWKNEMEYLKPSDVKFPFAFCLTYMENIINRNKSANKNMVKKLMSNKSLQKERT